MKSYVKDMTVGRPARLLISFMLPMVVGNIFQQLYNMVDSIIVGQYVGADALASVGATGSLNFLFFSLCGGLANGIGIVVSQHFGAGHDGMVKKAVANAAYIMLTVGTIMGSLGILLSRPVLTFLKTPDNILDDAVLYMQIMCAGVLAVVLYNCVSAILRAVGDSKTPLYFLIVASLLNIGLDLLFVRTFNMGVAGAGIATIIAQLIAGTGSLLFAIFKNPYFKIKKEQMKVNKDIIWQSVRIGVPLAFQSSLIAISCVALQSVVNTFGSVVVAAFTATGRIEQLVQQPYNSLGMAMSTYTGQNVGAGKLDRVKEGYRKGFLIMAVFSLMMLPLAQFGGEAIMRMFVSEPAVIEMGASALRITSWFYLFLGTIYVTRGLLNGAGDAAFAFLNGIVEVIGRICLAKPLTMIPMIGVWGVWFATGLTWFITGIFSYVRYLQGKWKRNLSERKPARLYLVRHGETDWNIANRIQGQTDTPLNDNGRQQARELADKLCTQTYQIKKIYSSRQKRALETAQIIGTALSLSPEVHEGLEEMSLGDWEGYTWKRVREQFADEYGIWYKNRRYQKTPNGESYQELLNRLLPALMDIMKKETQDTLIVTHSAVVMTLMSYLYDTPFEDMAKHYKIENAAIVELDTELLCMRYFENTPFNKEYLEER